jgi:hypothetical protein
MRYATSLAKAALALVLPFILAHLRKPGVRATAADLRCANAEWHLAACHLALPELSVSPMRPQLQEPQTAPCVTLVTQARRVGCYRLSLSTLGQVSKAMNRERYRPDAIDGSVVSGTISDGGRWMTRHQIERSRTRECPSLPSFSPLYFTFPSFLLFFGPCQRRAPH